THSTIEGGIMNERMTFTGVVGLLAAALLVVSCSDSVGPRAPAFDTAPTVVEVTGLGQLGTGSPSPGNNVQTFDFDVKSDLTGTLTYTDYTFPDTLLVGPTIPGTGITAFRTSSSACSDPTRTSRTSLPASGYTATVDGARSQPIGINSSVTFTGLTATGHTVTLSGVPTNSTVSGGTSQTVTVPAGGTATAAFSVSCTAT